MKVRDNYKGFRITQPTSGGKAGKGFNLSSTIQVKLGNLMVKDFRFLVQEQGSRSSAIRRAIAWIEKNEVEVKRRNGAYVQQPKRNNVRPAK